MNMSEEKLFIALQTLLAKPAEAQFRTNVSGGSLHSGIISWSEAIQYLLRTYATSLAMRKVLDDVRNTR